MLKDRMSQWTRKTSWNQEHHFQEFVKNYVFWELRLLGWSACLLAQCAQRLYSFNSKFLVPWFWRYLIMIFVLLCISVLLVKHRGFLLQISSFVWLAMIEWHFCWRGFLAWQRNTFILGEIDFWNAFDL